MFINTLFYNLKYFLNHRKSEIYKHFYLELIYIDVIFITMLFFSQYILVIICNGCNFAIR